MTKQVNWSRLSMIKNCLTWVADETTKIKMTAIQKVLWIVYWSVLCKQMCHIIILSVDSGSCKENISKSKNNKWKSKLGLKVRVIQHNIPSVFNSFLILVIAQSTHFLHNYSAIITCENRQILFMYKCRIDRDETYD